MGVAKGTGQYVARGVYLTQWTLVVGSASVGNWVNLPNLPDKSIEVLCTAGAGKFVATLIVQGSNQNNIAWGTSGGSPALASSVVGDQLNNPQGTALSFTTGKILAVLENTQWIRPRVTVSGAGANANQQYIVRLTAESRLR